MLKAWLRQISTGIIYTWRRRIGPQLLPLLTTLEVVGLVLAGLGLWAFAEIADEVLEQETRGFDTAILLLLRRLHTPLLNQLMIGITFLGEPTFLVIISGIVSGLMALKQQWFRGVVFLIAALGATGLNVLLKNVFARSRPALWERSVDVSYSSFPSGHAMVAFVIYGLIGYLLAARFKHRSGLILGLTLLLVTLIGLSRLYLGVHWPTDVVAGYAAGLVWLVACVLTLEIGQRQLQKHS